MRAERLPSPDPQALVRFTVADTGVGIPPEAIATLFEPFTVSTSDDSAADEVHVNLTLDRGKFQKDTEKAVEETRKGASHLSNSIKQGALPTNERAHDRTAAAPPNSEPDHL